MLGLGTVFSLPLLGKEIQLADIFFLLVLTAITIDIKRRGFKRVLFQPPVLIRYFLLFFLLFLFIASIFSLNKMKSFLELFAMIYLVILYLWVSGIDIKEKQFKSILLLWLYLSFGLCLLSLGGFVLYSFLGKNNSLVQFYPTMQSVIPFSRICATFPTMNMFASFLHISIIFLLVLIVISGWRKSYILISFFILICLFLTGSRNLFGICISVFLILVPLKKSKIFSLSKYAVFALSILLFFSLLVTTIWCIFPVRAYLDRQNNNLSMSINTAPSLYAVLNKMSVSLISKNPLLGVGPGMFNQNLVASINWNDVKSTYLAKGFNNKDVFLDPHNAYLGWAAEAGVPFVLVMLGLLYAIVRFMYRGYLISKDSFCGFFSYACMCGIIGFLVNGMYIDILTLRHFWLMLGLGTLSANRCLIKDKS